MKDKGINENHKIDSERRLGKRLNLPLAMEAGQAPGFYSGLLTLGFFFVFSLIIWTTVAEVREMAIAPGELTPDGSTRIVQHLEGGLIAEINVQEGEEVKRGQIMVRLQPVEAISDLRALHGRITQHRLRIESLAALINKRAPDFNSIPEVEGVSVSDQLATYKAAQSRYLNERLSLEGIISSRETEVANSEKLLESEKQLVAVAKEEYDLKKGLYDKSLLSATEFLSSQRAYETARNAVIQTQGNYESSLGKLSQGRRDLETFETKQQESWTSEHNQLSAELAELRANYIKAEARVMRLDVRAPVSGIVQDFLPKAIGQVIKSGEILSHIVPVDGNLFAEVRVSPKDIGHVKVGMPAELKLTTFDQARYGTISAEVEKISPSTFMDENGQPYYKANLKLARNTIGLNGEAYKILPGMEISAEIITGTKSVARYMMKPVFRALDLAMTER